MGWTALRPPCYGHSIPLPSAPTAQHRDIWQTREHANGIMMHRNSIMTVVCCTAVQQTCMSWTCVYLRRTGLTATAQKRMWCYVLAGRTPCIALCNHNVHVPNVRVQDWNEEVSQMGSESVCLMWIVAILVQSCECRIAVSLSQISAIEVLKTFSSTMLGSWKSPDRKLNVGDSAADVAVRGQVLGEICTLKCVKQLEEPGSEKRKPRKLDSGTKIPTGTLHIGIVEGTDLSIKDPHRGTSDPFCKVRTV